MHEQGGLPTVPGFHTFRFVIPYSHNNETGEWHRYWSVSDLSVAIHDNELAWEPVQTLEATRKVELKRLKTDLERYLSHHHLRLVEVGGALEVVAE